LVEEENAVDALATIRKLKNKYKPKKTDAKPIPSKKLILDVNNNQNLD